MKQLSFYLLSLIGSILLYGSIAYLIYPALDPRWSFAILAATMGFLHACHEVQTTKKKTRIERLREELQKAIRNDDFELASDIQKLINDELKK